jgi:hypothetical protein
MSTNRVSRSASFCRSQAKISSILPNTNSARRRLNFGGIGVCLVIKLVKPTKVFGSWPPDQGGINQLLLSQAEPQVWTCAARILRKTDAAVRREVCRLDSPDRVLGQMTKLLTLHVGDRRAQILDFHQPFANEYHQSHFSDAGYPGIANQLGIESQQPLRFFGISAGGCLPFQQAARPIKFSDPINVGDEFISRDWPGELDLQVAPRLVNPDAVILAEAGEKHDPLLEHAIPSVVVRKMQILIFASRPFAKEDVSGIFTAKVSTQSLFEGTPEEHRSTRGALRVCRSRPGNVVWFPPWPDAIKSFRKALALRQALVSSRAAKTEDRVGLARSCALLGRLLLATEGPSSALDLTRKSVEILEPLQRSEPSDPKVLAELQNSYDALGDLYSSNSAAAGMGMLTQAAEIHVKAADLGRARAKLFPQGPGCPNRLEHRSIQGW